MRSGFSRYLAEGIGSSLLGQILTFGQSLLLVPLFLKAWGTGGYGHWIAATSVLAYLALLDLGGQAHIGNVLTAAHAKADASGFQETLSEALSFYVAIGLASYAVLAVLVFIFSKRVAPFLGRPLSHDEAMIAYFLGGNYSLLAVPSGVFVTVYRACDRFARGTMVGNAGRFFALACSAAALAWGYSQGAFAAIGCFASAATTLVMWIDARRLHPAIPRFRLSPRFAIKGARHLRTSFQACAGTIAQMSMQQGVVIVIAAFIPAANVAIYVTHRLVASMVATLALVVQGPLLPELTALWTRDDRAILRSLHKTSVQLMTVVAAVAAFFLWLIAGPVFPLWTGGRMQLDPMLLAVLLVQAVLSAGWNTASWTMQATSRFKPLTLWTIANAVVTVALTIPAARVGNLALIAAASLCGDIICGLAPFPYLAARHDHSEWTTYYKAMALGLACATLPLAPLILLGVNSGRWSLILGIGGLALTGLFLTLNRKRFAIGQRA